MTRGAKVPVTPALVAWAIEQSGLSRGEIAEKVGVSSSELTAWSDGTSQPSITELRALAATVRRPVAAFLLPAPPSSRTPRVDFRKTPGVRRAKLNPDELRRLREAGRLQSVLSWIERELGQQRVNIARANVTSNPEMVA